MLKTSAIKMYQYLKKGIQKLWQSVSRLAVSWPKAFAGAIVLLLLLYYPLGGSMTEKIDKTAVYDSGMQPEGRSVTVETMAFLINREVNEHIWTPNLPLFFPSYFLDNMPAYQNGIISALAKTSAVIDAQTECDADDRVKTAVSAAAELLKYPGNVWLFAADNKLKIAPSSASQYRKARKQLRDFNRMLPGSACRWEKNAANLQKLVAVVQKDLQRGVGRLEIQIAEHSSDWFDTKADDLFYFNQGKMYAYMLILKAWGSDFKQVLLDTGQYQNWTKAIRALGDGTELSPTVVRNGELNSGLAANHLIALGYYMLRAGSLLDKVSDETKGVSVNAD